MNRNVLAVGGFSAIAAGVAAFFANRKANETLETMKDAVEGVTKEGAPVLPVGTGITVPVRITGYWPFKPGMNVKERLMEGGVNDRLGKPLRTLEDFQAGKTEYVSVSGDFKIFPYGQRISLSNWPGVVFRIVDTGCHFYDDPLKLKCSVKGAQKVFRVVGREPLDVCVLSSATKVVALQDATIYPGDHFGAKVKSSPKAVAYQKIGKPTAVGYCGLDLLGADSA